MSCQAGRNNYYWEKMGILPSKMLIHSFTRRTINDNSLMAATLYFLFPVACAGPGSERMGPPSLAPVALAGKCGVLQGPALPRAGGCPAKSSSELLALK